jgi:ADP-heptose:LPS heptosyltransferase
MSRLLFITSNRIGDAVLSTAALEYARQNWAPGAIDIVSGPLAAPLFRATPKLDRLITIDKRPGRWRALWGQLRDARYDWAIDLRGSLTTLGLRCGHRIIHRKRPADRHKIVELAELMKSPTPLRPQLHMDAQADRDASEILAGAQLILALGAGANFIGKRWPPDRFAALAEKLTEPTARMHGATIVLLGAPDDFAICAEIEERLSGCGRKVVNAAGRIDLLAGASALQRAALFVGNDSGLMHIAACVGAPTLGLFGPSNEHVYGPCGRITKALRGRAYEEIMAIGYMPDIKRTLMEDISVDSAFAAAQELLATGDRP